MPNALPTACADPACPEVSLSRYCEAHRTKRWQGDRRPSARQRGYDRQWDKVRARYVAKHPLCEPCAERGLTVPVKIVDHIVPLPHGKRLDPANLQSMCRVCHAKKTAADRGRAG